MVTHMSLPFITCPPWGLRFSRPRLAGKVEARTLGVWPPGFLGNPDTDRRDARLRIGLRPACAASGFFQCLVGHSGNEEFLFGLVDGVVSSVRMVIHNHLTRNRFTPWALALDQQPERK